MDVTGNKTKTVYPIQGIQKTISDDYEVGIKLVKKSMRTIKNRPGTYVDFGHNFYTRKDFYEGGRDFLGTARSITRYPWFDFTGRIVASKPDWNAAALKAKESTDASLDAFGSSAIAKVRPTKPAFDGATNLIELLREGLPNMVGASLMKSQMRDIRKLGDEHLNYQFGIAPLVEGIKDGVKTVSEAEKILAQLMRDNNRMIRRRFYADPVTTTQNITLTNQLPYGCSNAYIVGTPTTLTRKIETTQQRWFSGSFTYHLPNGNDMLNTCRRFMKQAEMIYGIRATPEVLWNLSPWSWFSDWFLNMGDIMSNISAFSSEGLVMRYGYVMETTTVTYTDRIRIPLGSSPAVTLTHSYGTTIKVRRRATPYGFGLNPATFDGYQLGIIGALGLANLPKR